MGLELNLKLTPTVSPQMILSMTMLQYSAQELEEYLEELSYENPLMELEQREENGADFLQRQKWLRDGDWQNPEEFGAREEWNRPEKSGQGQEGLADHLKEQILLLKVPKDVRKAMETLVELLTPRGFFDGSLGEAAALAGCSVKTSEKALEWLKTLSPAGVGAKNVRECLLLQLQRKAPRDPVAERLIQEHFDHLVSWPGQRLAADLGVSPSAVELSRKRIDSLHPYPGDGFASKEETLYIKPDLYIREVDGVLSVVPSEEAMPRIRMNRQYLNMLESEQDPDVLNYLKTKLLELEQVIKNLENRKSTVIRCAEVILQLQEDYFRGKSLRKMTLRDVAKEMGVHESTVSRTVRGKYIQCSRALVEMRDLFSRDVGQNMGISREEIKARMLQLIQEEDGEKPLTDEKIAEKLAREKMILSRRTVAQYRMELGILPASARKRQRMVRG